MGHSGSHHSASYLSAAVEATEGVASGGKGQGG